LSRTTFDESGKTFRSLPISSSSRRIPGSLGRLAVEASAAAVVIDVAAVVDDGDGANQIRRLRRKKIAGERERVALFVFYCLFV